MLERVTAEGRAGEEGLSKLAFLVMGVMATLAALFKQGHRFVASPSRWCFLPVAVGISVLFVALWRAELRIRQW